MCLETNWAISFNCREHNEHGDSIKGTGKTVKAKDSQHYLPEEDTSQWVQETRIAAILFSTLVFWSKLNNNFSNAGSITNFIPRSVDKKRGNGKASNQVHFCVPIVNRKGILKTTVFRSSCNKFLQSRESSRDSISLKANRYLFPFIMCFNQCMKIVAIISNQSLMGDYAVKFSWSILISVMMSCKSHMNEIKLPTSCSVTKTKFQTQPWSAHNA